MAKSGLVVAREAIVINVGGRPIEWHTADVTNKRTGAIHKDLPLTEAPPKDPGDEGIPYAFKAFQRVNRNHPAVKECPDAFIPIEDLSPAEAELVTN